MSARFEEVLDLYGLQEGDKATVRLALTAVDVAATMTDDRLLYSVLHRCGHQALFPPDFIEKAVADHICDATTGQQLLLAVRPRLQRGFVEHSLARCSMVGLWEESMASNQFALEIQPDYYHAPDFMVYAHL
jgi:hypothetical protein